MLLYSQIGFWYDLCKEKIPEARFLMQDEYIALGELVQASVLPAFSTNLVRNNDERHMNRVFIPILDSEASVNYYCICKKKSNTLLGSFLRQIHTNAVGSDFTDYNLVLAQETGRPCEDRIIGN